MRCYPFYTSVGMHALFETSDILELVVNYVGFVPSRFYLRECSRFLHREVSGIIGLDRKSFYGALQRQLVNPKVLRLEVSELSDSLIEELTDKVKDGKVCSSTLEVVLSSRSMALDPRLFQDILECGIVRMNRRIIDIALNYLEELGLASKMIRRLFRKIDVRHSLMREDALELLERMTSHVPLSEDRYLAENYMVCATEFQAQKCMNYLQGFTGSWECIDGMLQACAHAGDLERVKALCSGTRCPPDFVIQMALKQAIHARRLEVAAFLRYKWDELNPNPSLYAMRSFVNDLLDKLDSRVDCALMTLIFGRIDNDYFRNMGTHLEFAIDARNRIMCDYLTSRGCILEFPDRTLEGRDLLDFVDLCLTLETDCSYEKHPAAELFLLNRGIQTRRNLNEYESHLFRILLAGFETASFANRLDLIKYYLRHNPPSATETKCLFHIPSLVCRYLTVTPLGLLELLGTPRRRFWDGRNVIGSVLAAEPDEWELSRPDEIEIQALRDIRTALVESGADPNYLFAPCALHGLEWEGNIVPAEFVKRLIDGRADVNHERRGAERTLTRAFATYQPVDVIKVLLESGAWIDPEDELDAQNILWIALRKFALIRYPEILPLVIHRKANINSPNRDIRRCRGY